MHKAGGPPPQRAEVLAHECRMFCRYLADIDATPDIERAYQRAHEIGSLKLAPATPLDHVLLRLASRGQALARVADAFAGPIAPGSALRRKLVVLVAILESRGTSAARVDHAVPGSLVAWVIAAGLHGTGWLVRFAIGALLIGPMRIWYSVSNHR